MCDTKKGAAEPLLYAKYPTRRDAARQRQLPAVGDADQIMPALFYPTITHMAHTTCFLTSADTYFILLRPPVVRITSAIPLRVGVFYGYVFMP